MSGVHCCIDSKETGGAWHSPRCSAAQEEIERRVQPERRAILPVMSSAERKNAPVYRGVLLYFPDAVLAVADVSRVGNDQHNKGQPMHWAKHKSTDHGDCIGRHLIDAGTLDTDGLRHSAKVAWRALALLQTEIEAERAGLSVDDYIKRLQDEAGKK